jgi:manganese/zinc/iron transport system permease protein
MTLVAMTRVAWPSLVAAAGLLGGGITYNTLVVLAGVAAVGFAAGVAGTLALLRRRPLVGDAAAHATLLGVGAAFLLTGRRDLPTLLAGALVSAVAALGVLVFLRRVARTRDDAATAIVIGVSFGAGLAVVAGITARGLPGSAGLEQFLLGHTAALTARDAALLAAASLGAVVVVAVAFKEAVMVAFDAAFAAASGWPVGLIDGALVALVAVMVVVGLPAAGAVLVTALVVIPPVAARQWTSRAGPMLLVAGLIGLAAAVAGVAVSTLRPGLATGPLVVLAAAAICLVSFVAAPERGWLARRVGEADRRRRWTRGRVLEECLELCGDAAATGFEETVVIDRAAGDTRPLRREAMRAWAQLVRDGSLERATLRAAAADAGRVEPGRGAMPQAGRDRWWLSAAGLAQARERRRRIDAWRDVLDAGIEGGRDLLTLDLPAPDEVLDAAALAPLAAARRPPTTGPATSHPVIRAAEDLR